MTRRFLPVGGTWSYDGLSRGQWWQEGSEVLAFLARHGLEPYDAADPYVWDGELGGLPWDDRHVGWRASGLHLKRYAEAKTRDCRGRQTQPVVILTHSHGAQPLAYACQAGLTVDVAVTLMAPRRADMLPVWEQARPRIKHWLWVYSDWSDRMQVLGALFDRSIGINRKMPLADVQLNLRGVGHSRMLHDPKYMPQLVESGIVDTLLYGGQPPTVAERPCPHGAGEGLQRWRHRDAHPTADSKRSPARSGDGS